MNMFRTISHFLSPWILIGTLFHPSTKGELFGRPVQFCLFFLFFSFSFLKQIYFDSTVRHCRSSTPSHCSYTLFCQSVAHRSITLAIIVSIYVGSKEIKRLRTYHDFNLELYSTRVLQYQYHDSYSLAFNYWSLNSLFVVYVLCSFMVHLLYLSVVHVFCSFYGPSILDLTVVYVFCSFYGPSIYSPFTCALCILQFLWSIYSQFIYSPCILHLVWSIYSPFMYGP